MRILYIGDIMGERGVEAVRRVLPNLKSEHNIDFVVAQAENVTDGKGLSLSDYELLRSLGIDCLTGGNWTLHRDEIIQVLERGDEPAVRPANYPVGTPGKGWKLIPSSQGRVLVISLLGSIVGRDADKPMDNPLKVVDAILEQTKADRSVATVVNFHGDFSSEKVVIGYYLDGRVTAVLGDHWHVPTADAMVLPKGTAHMSDVGMCGVLHSSLGVKTEVIVRRWRDGRILRNELETDGVLQFNAALVETDATTGLATSIEHVHRIID